MLDELARLCVGPGAGAQTVDLVAIRGGAFGVRRQQARFNYLRGSVVELMQRHGVLPRYGLARSSPGIRFEAHLNAERIEAALWPRLLALGFQPDDFLEPHPVLYRRNWTFSFDIPARDKRGEAARQGFMEVCDACQSIMETHDSGAVFLEREEIKGDTIRNFSVAAPAVAAPPLPPIVRALTTLSGDPGDKRCDLHVKLRGADGVEGVAPLGLAQRALAIALEDSGFYRIVSASRNTILTAQFLNGSLARKVFNELCETLGPSGLVASVVLEPCKGLWRKQVHGNALSPVCHLVDARA